MQPRSYSPAFFFSVTLHVVVLLILIVSFEFSSTMQVIENVDNNSKVINAVAVDAPPAPIISQPPPPPAQPKVVKKAPPTPPEPPKPTEQQLQAIQKTQEIEVKKLEAIALNEKKKKLAEQKAVIEKQLLADLKKQVVKDKVKDKAKKEKALEQAMEQEIKEQTAKTLQQQLQKEQTRLAGAKSLGQVNKYTALILQAISQRWLVPQGVDKSLSTKLLIRLAPGGAVLDVQITKSSGNVSLDRSARDAVFKASPLPVPTDGDGFDQFRQFVLKVKPENVTQL